MSDVLAFVRGLGDAVASLWGLALLMLLLLTLAEAVRWWITRAVRGVRIHRSRRRFTREAIEENLARLAERRPVEVRVRVTNLPDDVELTRALARIQREGRPLLTASQAAVPPRGRVR